MRILLVSPFLPYPPRAGGHGQIWGWMKRLSERHELAFVGFYEREEEAGSIAEVRGRCVAARARLRKPTAHAFPAWSNVPFWVSEYFSAELAEDVAEVSRSFRPEVALFCSTNMAQYRRAVRGVPAVVNALEISFVAHARRITAAHGWERLRARLEWARVLRAETRVFREADGVVAVSSSDAEIIRTVAPRASVTAVPPGVDAALLEPRKRHPQPGRVLYVGHMEHYPNLDGLLFLYRDIWPRVLQELPQATLTVAGGGIQEELSRVAPEELRALESDPSVDLAGFVPDLHAVMDATAVMAAPLRLGGGVRNKVVEAMALGLPVVATHRGAEGLAARDGEEVLLADDPEGFARELVRVLRDEARQEQLSAAGRELAARDHNNDDLAQRLELALARVVGARR